MKLPNPKMLGPTIRSLSKTMSKKSPVLYSGLAVLGTASSVVLMHIATKKAVKKMDEVKEQEDYITPDTTVRKVIEEVKETWQYYIPVTAIVLVTIVSEVQSTRISLKRLAVVTDAYRMSENLRKEYEDKVKEVIGPNKEEKIRTAIAQDNIDRDPPQMDAIYDTGEGRIIFKDKFTGRYFYQDIEKMRQAKNQLDALILREDCANLNSWFYLIKIEPLDEVGTDFGWNLERLDRKDLSDIRFIPGVTHEGIPCYIVEYHVELNYDMYEPF